MRQEMKKDEKMREREKESERERERKYCISACQNRTKPKDRGRLSLAYPTWPPLSHTP